MHLIFNYCLALQTTGKCQSEQSSIGASQTNVFFGKLKKRRTLEIKYVWKIKLSPNIMVTKYHFPNLE